MLVVLALYGGARASTDEPAIDCHPRSPADELATIHVPAGYHLELVAADPDVVCPALCEWDGNGRMYVAELRSYMLDINGTHGHDRTSRVSRWEQTRGDGVYDRHTVYADGLLLPRMVLPLDDRVLIRETDTKDIVSYRDRAGTGVADERTTVYVGGKQEGNLEHQPSGLVWDADNWLYVTNQDERFRFTRGSVEKQTLAFGNHPGQWGIATTADGQTIFCTAGTERPAHNFQAMPAYGDLGLGGELAKDFTAVHPIEHLTDVEGGPPRLLPGGGLNHFSGCCGPCVYQGETLPELDGDLFIPEPVGRLIRRAKITDDHGKTVVVNPDDSAEFIASTDPNFRPVWAATGPDGLIYFCDLYHGIIQESNWTQEGSYLRPQILKYGLEKNVGRGRIWRLVRDGVKPRAMPHMLDETTAELVAHLADPNGWWRDTAQKLIVLRGDASVAPALMEMATKHADPIARLHALWTLEGLDAATDATIRSALSDPDPRVRAAAIRVAEPTLRSDPTLARTIAAMTADADPKVVTQVALTALTTKVPGSDAVVAAAVGRFDVTAQLVGNYRALEAKAWEQARKATELAAFNKQSADLFKKGETTFGQTCVACHAADGNGTPAPDQPGVTLAPPLRGSRKLLADRQVCVRVVLHGLVGPNNGTTYPGQMASFKWIDDEWLASALTYARNSWGNKADAIRPADVAAVRAMTADRDRPFTVAELYAAAEADAPVTPTGAHVAAAKNEIVLDPATATLHGSLHVDCYPSGLDVGFWNDPHDWVSWTVHLDAGDYAVAARTSSADRGGEFVVHVAGAALPDSDLPGTIPHTDRWDDYRDVPVGTVHVGQPSEVTVEVRPRQPGRWGPSNLAAVRLARK